MLYGYDTSATTSNVYTRQGVYNEANRLLSSLRIRRQGVVENVGLHLLPTYQGQPVSDPLEF